MKPIFAGILLFFLASNTIAQSSDSGWIEITNVSSVLSNGKGRYYAVNEKEDRTEIDLIYYSESGVITCDTGAVVLFQNLPNPFINQTIIRFYVRENIQQAQLNLYDSSGKLVVEFSLTEKGNGEVKVLKPALPFGIYSYVLLIEGVNVASRTMEKQQTK